MSLIQSIENDLKAAGTWLEDEVEHEGEAVWSIVETVFKQGVGFDSQKLIASAQGMVGIR